MLVLMERRVFLQSVPCWVVPFTRSATIRVEELRRESDEWFWILVFQSVQGYPPLGSGDVRRRLVDGCELEYLTRDDVLQVLEDAWVGEFGVEVIPDDAINLEGRVMFSRDRERLQKLLG